MDAEGRAAADPIMAHSGVALRSTVNTNLAYGAESPVDAMAPTSAGFHDVMGNLWQVGRGGTSPGIAYDCSIAYDRGIA